MKLNHDQQDFFVFVILPAVLMGSLIGVLTCAILPTPPEYTDNCFVVQDEQTTTCYPITKNGNEYTATFTVKQQYFGEVTLYWVLDGEVLPCEKKTVLWQPGRQYHFRISRT